MNFFEQEKQEDAPDDRPADSTMLVLIALIRALHERGILPAQAVADVLDRRALNAAPRGTTSRESDVQKTAVAVQELADLVERQTPFVSRDQPVDPASPNSASQD